MKISDGNTDVLEANEVQNHVSIFGTTGSGKTGLAIAIAEEALLADVHVLAIDTRGDLTNLALVFDGFNAQDFEPWTERVSAVNAVLLAEEWRAGIEAEGNLDRHARLANIPRTIYTPGSSSGVPLNVLASLTAPASDDIPIEIDTTLNAVFELIDESADPTSPGYVVCGLILQHYWQQSRPISLEGLIVSLIDPPFTKVGLVAADQFMDATARRRLAVKLNLLLASSAFQALAAGRGFEPSEFFSPTAEASCSIVSLSHLDQRERQFVVSRLLAEITAWMRTLSGTSTPRLLVMLDEAAEYCPATSKPPAKDEVLALAKTGRAFGVGLVTSTHNPTDVDHRLMANSATWLVGRLQADRDFNRLVEAGAGERGNIREAVAGLDDRQFVSIKTAEDSLETFRCRHTLSFLAGPLARPQIRELTERISDDSIEALHDSSGRPAAGVPDDRVLSTGEAIPDLPQRWAVGEWTSEFGGTPGSSGVRPALVVTADLTWDRNHIDLHMIEERHEINFPIGSDNWWTERTLGGLLKSAEINSGDEEDALDEPVIAAQIAYALARLENVRTREVAYAPSLQMWARPGESIAAFRSRCRAEAIKAARAEVMELDKHLDRQSSSALDRLAELTTSDQADLDELRLHLAGVVAELRNAKHDTSEIAAEIEADWLASSSRIEMQTLTIDPEADIAIIPWILWIPAP